MIAGPSRMDLLGNRSSPGLLSGFCSLGTTASALAVRHMARERLFWVMDALGRAGHFLVPLRALHPPGDPQAKSNLGYLIARRIPACSASRCASHRPACLAARTAGRSCRQPSPSKLAWVAELLLASAAPGQQAGEGEPTSLLLATCTSRFARPPAYGGANHYVRHAALAVDDGSRRLVPVSSGGLMARQ